MTTDWHDILLRLTNFYGNIEDGGGEDFLQRTLEEVLSDVQPMLIQSLKTDEINKINEINKVNEINEVNEIKEVNDEPKFDASLRYVKTLILALEKLNEVTEDQDSISVCQFRTVKRSIDLIFVLGVAPNLLPGVGVEPNKIFPKLSTLKLISDGNRSEYQKYHTLRVSLQALLKFFHSFLFRPSIIHRLNLLLPSLLQLSHAPLKKSSPMYGRLEEEQNEFKVWLTRLIDECPKFMTMKELMVMLGVKGSPKWLRMEVRKLLVRLLTQDDGVTSLFAAVCEDSVNDCKDWQKFETISRLVVANHCVDEEEYYSSVCKQLLDLLKSNDRFSSIATICISTLYETNPRICRSRIVEILLQPLSRPKSRVFSCIESLRKIFSPSNETNFNYSLPCDELSKVALQLFSIYQKSKESPFLLKNKVKELLLVILSREELNHDLFDVFLNRESIESFGRRLKTTFASDGDVEIISLIENDEDYEFSMENRMDTLHDLSTNNETILNNFFRYLLQRLTSEMNEDKVARNFVSRNEETEGIEKELRMKMSAVQMLCKLSNVPSVIKCQLIDPRRVIDLIVSLIERPNVEEEIFYVGLMIVNEIFTASIKERIAVKMEPFRELVANLKRNEGKLRSTRLKSVAKELIDSIENWKNEKRSSDNRYFEDLSINENGNEFEEALNDLRDPLLPVRAHGIVKLTKLVEKRDFHAVAAKPLILQIFKDNLTDDDSFVYLAAINGLCALAASSPAAVIETLMMEYVRMPEKFRLGEISVENRCKLGEILVKTTRALGEMASNHKNLLINGFLCVTRDPDPFMRASSLSCLGELCKVLGFRLGTAITEVLYCVSGIVETDKSADCRRAAVMVATLLLRGLGSDALNSLGEHLTPLCRSLKRLRDRDEDPVLRLHAQLALEEFDVIARDFLLAPAKLEKRILLLP